MHKTRIETEKLSHNFEKPNQIFTRSQINIQGLLIIVTKNLESPDLEFVKNETIVFCKNQMLKAAIVKSVDLLQTGQYDEIKRVVDNAMRAGTHRDIGLEYVKNFEQILEDINRDTVATSWEAIDFIMDGGLAGGELGVVVAPSGIGKSWFLQAFPQMGQAMVQGP